MGRTSPKYPKSFLHLLPAPSSASSPASGCQLATFLMDQLVSSATAQPMPWHRLDLVNWSSMGFAACL